MDAISKLIVDVAATPQFKFLVGLIFLNFILAVSAALRTGSFDWAELAGWFRGQVMPYVIGYIGLAVSINLILPVDVAGNMPPELMQWLNVGAVDFAWLTLVATLGNKIIVNARLLYGGK